MFLLLVAQSDPLGPYTSTVTAIIQLGLAVFLTLYLIVKSGPAERKAADERLLKALSDQREDHEKWRIAEREATTNLVKVLGEVHGEVVREIKSLLGEESQKLIDIEKKLDEGFRRVEDLINNRPIRTQKG